MLEATLAAMPSERIAMLLDALIAELDARDGDPDLELTGDENEDAEGEYRHHFDGRGRCFAGTDAPIGGCEDDEDDDPGGGNVEDEGETGPSWRAPSPRYGDDQRVVLSERFGRSVWRHE